jgi:hypothetical protein
MDLIRVPYNSIVGRPPEDYGRDLTQVSGVHDEIITGNDHVKMSQSSD